MAKKNGNGKKETGLAVIGGQEFAILKAGIAGLNQSLAENIGAEGLSPFELDRVRIPAGGTKAWVIPGVDQDEVVGSFTGVIIYHKLGRVYWEKGLDEGGGNTPPDCSSDDSITGIGTPGGSCNKCPFAEFGSSKKGKGQACKQLKLLFVMRENGMLPICVSLPPTSLRKAKQYMLRLASRSLPYYAVLTKFDLEEASNGEGIKYSRAVLTTASMLEPAQVEQFKRISMELRPYLQAVRVEPTDYAAEPTEE